MKKAILLILLFSIGLVSANVCDSLYFFILENNYNYTDVEFIDLSNKLNISLNNLTNYKENYTYLCNKQLPKQKVPIKIFYKNITNCDLGFSPILNLSIPSKLKYIFKIDKQLGNYVITKIRVYFLMSIFVLIITLKIIRNEIKLGKMMKKEK